MVQKIKCSDCGVEKTTKITKSGGARLPRNWKLWKDHPLCDKCVDKATEVRSTTVTVEPADLLPMPAHSAEKAERDAWWAARRAHPFYHAAKTHFAAVAGWKTRVVLDLARHDPIEIFTDGKNAGRLKPWPDQLKKEVIARIGKLGDTFASVLNGTEKWHCVRSASEHYFGKSTQIGIPRRELVLNPKYLGRGEVKGERLAQFVAPQPVPLKSDAIRGLVVSGDGFRLSLKLGERYWDLRIPPGRRNDRAMGVLLSIVEKQTVVLEYGVALLPHNKVDTQIKITFRRFRTVGGAKATNRTVIAATTPTDLIAIRVSGHQSNDRAVWTGDILKGLAYQSQKRLQGFSDDRKASDRRGSMSDAYYMRLEEISRRLGKAKKHNVNVIARQVIDRVRRIGGDTLLYDDRERSGWPRTIPWSMLRDRLQAECDRCGLSFVFLPDRKADAKDEAAFVEMQRQAQEIASIIKEQAERRNETWRIEEKKIGESEIK